MRTIIVKLYITVIPLVVLATLVIFSSGAARKVARFQAAAVSHAGSPRIVSRASSCATW